MPLLAIILTFSLSSFAFEVATISSEQQSSSEQVLVLTDEALRTSLINFFAARPCKIRTSSNTSTSTREHFFYKPCRAEVIQFLLNNGYKADPYFKTFIK